MERIVIADRSDDICFVLRRRLQKDFEVHTCNDGPTALSMIRSLRPAVLVLDIRLPVLDGLSLLQELAEDRPPAILMISDTNSSYESRAAVALGASLVMVRPFENRALYSHIYNLAMYARDPERFPPDLRTIVSAHLSRLGLDCAHDGYQQLRLGIPLFRQDPTLHLGKELYPAIIEQWGRGDSVSLERTIRSAIEAAWKKRDPEIWQQYFPDCEKCPNNKKFIARLSELSKLPKD